MTNQNTPTDGEAAAEPSLTRRSTLGALGAGAIGVGVGATGSVSADDDGPITVRDGGPNPGALVEADGSDWPDEPGDEMELFDAEPEFPPFTNFEGMKEDFNSGAVNRYLQEHGVANLLGSRRLVVTPDGDAATWDEYDGASATAYIEDASPGRGRGGGQDRSDVKIEFEGLYPDGVYTVWVVHEPGWHRPLGGNDGDENYFTADEEGAYTLEVTDRPAELTLPPGETEQDDEPVPITEYPLHEIPGDFFFVVAYHYDNRTWASQPGPFWVPQLVINDFGDD